MTLGVNKRNDEMFLETPSYDAASSAAVADLPFWRPRRRAGLTSSLSPLSRVAAVVASLPSAAMSLVGAPVELASPSSASPDAASADTTVAVASLFYAYNLKNKNNKINEEEIDDKLETINI